MENTLEYKAKFFALYFGQNVLKTIDQPNVLPLRVGEFLNYDNEYLSLTSLSNITDEDAVEVANIIDLGFLSEEERISFAKKCVEEIYTDNVANVLAWLQIFDLLRSKGYALPFMGLSVETIIEYGWIKLKSE